MNTPRRDASALEELAAPLCQFLDWDSAFFGVRIARVNISSLTADIGRRVDQWCRAHRIDCIYYLIDAHDQSAVRQAENSGYHLVDIRVTLDRDMHGWRISSSRQKDVRPARAEEIPLIQAIAASNHRDTRFYTDSHFPQEQCDRLYATWIANSYNGYADVVLVLAVDDVPVGYVTCKIDSDGWGDIGLLGVAPSQQGRGFGKELLKASLDWFAAHHVRGVRVVTQGRNIVSQRLYQMYGFRTRKVQLWYHKWFK